MKTPDLDDQFTESLGNAIEKFGQLSEERKALDADMTRLRQFMQQTVNLLSVDAREPWATIVEGLVDESSSFSSLTDATKKTLQNQYPAWLTAAKVRDYLIESGFDFSSYTSNQLASVSTTLRRLKDDVEMQEIEGVAHYRMPPSKSVERWKVLQAKAKKK
jgi:hypothetical protein